MTNDKLVFRLRLQPNQMHPLIEFGKSAYALS
jgi:hypothetical protein